ncbi:hypothetical protein B296_00027641, partial [Ensete ventricosum]
GGATHRRHGQLPLQQVLLPSGSTSRAGDRSCQRPPLQAVALVVGLPLAALQRAVATCDLATGGYPLRSHHGQQAIAAWPLVAAPCGLAAAVRACGATATTGGHPLYGSLGGSRPPLQGC